MYRRSYICSKLPILVLQKLKEPKASYAYEDKTEFEKQWSVMDQNSSSTFTLRKNHTYLIRIAIPYHGLGRNDTRLVVPNYGISIPYIYDYHYVYSRNG